MVDEKDWRESPVARLKSLHCRLDKVLSESRALMRQCDAALVRYEQQPKWVPPFLVPPKICATIPAT
jgi:hypothetical protein